MESNEVTKAQKNSKPQTPPEVRREIQELYHGLAQLSRRTRERVQENANPSGILTKLGIRTSTS